MEQGRSQLDGQNAMIVGNFNQKPAIQQVAYVIFGTFLRIEDAMELIKRE